MPRRRRNRGQPSVPPASNENVRHTENIQMTHNVRVPTIEHSNQNVPEIVHSNENICTRAHCDSDSHDERASLSELYRKANNHVTEDLSVLIVFTLLGILIQCSRHLIVIAAIIGACLLAASCLIGWRFTFCLWGRILTFVPIIHRNRANLLSLDKSQALTGLLCGFLIGPAFAHEFNWYGFDDETYSQVKTHVRTHNYR